VPGAWPGIINSDTHGDIRDGLHNDGKHGVLHKDGNTDDTHDGLHDRYDSMARIPSVPKRSLAGGTISISVSWFSPLFQVVYPK
jgi:hypothetical protein